MHSLPFIIPALRYRERVSAFAVYTEGNVFFFSFSKEEKTNNVFGESRNIIAWENPYDLKTG